MKNKMAENDNTIKRKGIPFLWGIYPTTNAVRGIDVNIFYKGVTRNKDESYSHGGNSRGCDLTGVVKYVDGDSKGVNVTGGAKIVDEDSEGVDITGLVRFINGNSKGINITGLLNYVDEKSKGINITGGYNYSKKVEDFLIEYGTLGNRVDEFKGDEFVLQIGLWNKIGNQYSPIINVRGIKNLSRVLGIQKRRGIHFHE